MKGSLEIKESEWNRLIKEIKTKYIRQVEVLLDGTPSLINEKDSEGNTALHWTALHGRTKMSQMLIERSPELLDAVNNKGSTALHRAASKDYEKLAKMLIVKHPKLLDAVDYDGNTALHVAAWNGHEKVAQILIAKHPKLLDAVNINGNTALHIAAANGHENVAQMLIAKHPKLLDAVTINVNTALHIAAANGHEKVVELLLSKNPKSIDAVSKNSYTALHWAAEKGHEKVSKVLLAMSPKLINAVDKDGKTALHLAAENGHENLVQTFSKAMHVLALQRKDLKVEENKTANKADQESKKLNYSQEEIHKLLSIQLQNEKNVNVELLDLSNPAKASIIEQQLQSFVDSAIEGNKTLAIALHLHGESWTSLVIKHIGENNLQVIYNDPTGNSFTKELAVKSFINSLAEQNRNGDINITDLRKSQQNIEADSGAVVVDNLVRLAKAKSLKKADLQKLLIGSNEINDLKGKHLLIEDTSPDYSNYKLNKILELSLKDQPVIIASVSVFENELLLSQNAKAAAEQVMNSGVPIVMPLSAQGKNWSGLVIKKQTDNSLQVIYNNPTGDSMRIEKNAKSLIAAIMDVNPEVHIFDVRCKQDDNKQASGTFTVNNLVKLALSDTSSFHRMDFQKLFSTSENIDQLRHQHAELLHGYIMSDLIAKFEISNLEMKGEREAFEQKEDRSEGKEEYSAPPPYEEDFEVQMHVLGEDAED